MSRITPIRGHIYRILAEPEGTALILVVSGNAQNTAAGEDECIAVHVSARTADLPRMPSWVRLSAGDPAYGYVVARDIGVVGHEELGEDLGKVCMETMDEVAQALKRVMEL